MTYGSVRGRKKRSKWGRIRIERRERVRDKGIGVIFPVL